MAWKYVTDDDVAEMGEFCRHHLANHASLPPGSLFHYTTGAGLIAIVGSGQLWSTQIGCLNDEKEYIYAVEQLQQRFRQKLAANPPAPFRALFEKIDDRLGNPRPEIAGVFITCFSAEGDDLSQRRAYSSGEGGYALQFDPRKLIEAGQGHRTYLVRMEYEAKHHGILLDDIVTWTEKFFTLGLSRNRAPSVEAWTEEFIAVWLWQLSFFAPASGTQSSRANASGVYCINSGRATSAT